VLIIRVQTSWPGDYAKERVLHEAFKCILLQKTCLLGHAARIHVRHKQTFRTLLESRQFSSGKGIDLECTVDEKDSNLNRL